MKKLLLGLIVLGLLLIPLAVSALQTEGASVVIGGNILTSIACQATLDGVTWNLILIDPLNPEQNTIVYGDVAVQSNHQWKITTNTGPCVNGFLCDDLLDPTDILTYQLQVLINSYPDPTPSLDSGYQYADAYDTGTIADTGDKTSQFSLRQQLSGADAELTAWTANLNFVCANVITPP